MENGTTLNQRMVMDPACTTTGLVRGARDEEVGHATCYIGNAVGG